MQGSEIGGNEAGVQVRRSEEVLLRSNEICGGESNVEADDPVSVTNEGNTFCTKAWF